MLYNYNMATNYTSSGPGKADREGITIIELLEMFPDDNAAREWFEDIRWPDGNLYCPRCFSERTCPIKSGKPMPYWCSDCRKYFSVKTGTVMEASNIPLLKWLIAIYLMTTNLKGVSSMKLHRDLGITQKSAWFMTQRIREGWNNDEPLRMVGPVEVDETYVGGKPSNRHASDRYDDDDSRVAVSDPFVRRRGRGTRKTPVVGVRDRATNRIDARPVPNVRRETLRGFIDERVPFNATLYTDEFSSYIGVRPFHETVNHSAGEYVRGQAHVNGLESFWAMLKRGYMGTYHKMSKKHLFRYVNEFAGRHNVRTLDTMIQIILLANSLIGRRLKYDDLIGPPETRLR